MSGFQWLAAFATSCFVSTLDANEMDANLRKQKRLGHVDETAVSKGLISFALTPFYLRNAAKGNGVGAGGSIF